jgi:hypothetical protein
MSEMSEKPHSMRRNGVKEFFNPSINPRDELFSLAMPTHKQKTKKINTAQELSWFPPRALGEHFFKYREHLKSDLEVS